MKLFATFFLVFALTACRNNTVETEVYPEIEVGQLGFPLLNLTSAARDYALADFDYLAEILLDNTPSLVIIERRWNLTLAELLDDVRSMIYNYEPVESLHHLLMGEDFADFSLDLPTDDLELAAHYLSSLLFWLSVDLGGIGHLGPRDFPTYWEQLEHAAALMHQADIIDGRLVVPDEEPGWDIRLAQSRFDAFAAEQTLLFFDVDMDDLDLDRELSDIGFREEGNVSTEVLVPGSVAYFRIDSFSNNPGFDSEILFPFFAEVRNYDHLIIDLRGNGGGWSHYFPNYVVATLIPETIVVNKHEFFMGGDLSLQLAEYSLASWFGSAYEILRADEFVAQHDFTYFNNDDLSVLEYVIPWELIIEPNSDEHIPFEGQIWLLVNEGSASASESAAVIATSSGFATVVGTNTMGVTGTMHTYVSLPSTGVLFRIDIGYTIDEHGRLMEEFGVTPDIVIDPDEDALEIVLELIEKTN